MNGKEFPYFTDPELLRSDDFLIDGEGLQLISETRGAWDSYPEFYLMGKLHDNARSHFLKNQYIDAIIYFTNLIRNFYSHFPAACSKHRWSYRRKNRTIFNTTL